MLCTSVVTLCLVCFLHCFEHVQCRSTILLNEYNNRSSLTRRCLRSCFLISKHQTCFEKCLGKNTEGDFNLNAEILRIPPHRTPTLKRRKRYTKEPIKCPVPSEGNNTFLNWTTTPSKQYENSSGWYRNVSWDPISDSTNFTGYGIIYSCYREEDSDDGWLKMQKNKTFAIFNESEPCRDFAFKVFVRPCRGYEDLYLTPKNEPEDTNQGATQGNPTVPTTNKVNTATVPTTNKVNTVVALTVIGITLVLVSATSATYLFLRKRKRDSRDVSSDDADYDAFIIFNQHDQKWVEETLLPILEKESNYKCCVHYRDFAIGKDFVANMADSVHNSRKVIAVISKTFFSSKWCNFELQQAIYKHIKRGDDGVIVIKIDNVSTEKFPKAIQTKSFIDYSNIVERPFFKKRLLRVLECSNKDNHMIPIQANV